MLDALSHPFCQRLTLTLAHFLWQGLLVAAVLGAVFSIVRPRRPHSRYVLSLAALGLMAACPIVTFSILAAVKEVQLPPRLADVAAFNDATPARQVAMHESGTSASRSDNRATDHKGRPNGQESSHLYGRGVAESLSALVTAAQPQLLSVWLTGVLISGVRLSGGCVTLFWLRGQRQPLPTECVDRVRRIARRLEISATKRVWLSPRIRETAVVGFWRPVVLVPTAWVAALPVDVLESVIAHELAHIRHCDVWVNLLQRFVESVLFYHPAVWWVSGRIRLEREMCCDELAVALEQVARLRTGAGLTLAASFLGEPKMNLLSRVHNVLKTDRVPEPGRWWPAGVVALAVPLAVLALAGDWPGADSAAFAQDEREGSKRSAERDTAKRDSPEARTGRPDSPDAREGAKRSAERDAPRRGGSREGRTSERFQPKTEREAALYRMIQQLQREVAELRGELRSRGGEREGSRSREGDRPSSERRRDGDAPARESTRESGSRWLSREEARQARIFQGIDKNRNRTVDAEEFNRLFEGADDPRVQARNRTFFKAADSDKDGKLTASEFTRWRLKGRRATEDGGTRKEGPRDGERPQASGEKERERGSSRETRDRE